ncbi:E3 ubiquitin-protein ligase UBR3 [Galdieria sulphuraria]|nr:E3 ubiquitin-protein ligase UBR3 [Galdieria sulphuraria]
MMELPPLEEELYSSTELAQDALNGLLQAAALDPLEGQYFQNRVCTPLTLSETKKNLEEARLAIVVALRGYKRLDISSMPFAKNRNFQMTTEIDISRLQFRVALAVIAHVMCRQCPGSSSLEYLRNLPGNIPRGGVCGTVWKKDELAYKCRTCERDPTCAICVQCFRNGNHEGHDFSIIRTGGGVCDCGDPQAWKPFGFCQKHGGAHSEEEDLVSKLPLELREGISLAVELLGEEFLLDETSNHVKVEIATWWRRIADCGDSFTRLVGMELCKSPGPCIRERTFRFEREDGSRPAFVWIFLRLDGAGMLENDTKNALHSLYFLLITDLVFKRKFLEYFGSLYSLFVDPLYQGSLSLLEDSSSNNTRDHFSVQLFTVPALVPIMIKHGGLIDQLLKILLQLMEAVSYPVRKVETIAEDWHNSVNTVFGAVHLPQPLAHDKCIDLTRDRGLDTLNRVIYDLRYILTHTNAAAYVMHYRPDLLALFVRILSLLQGMNAEVRAVRYHVERESDIWSKAISLELDFNHLCELLLAGFVFNKLEEIKIDSSDIDEGTGTENSSLSSLPQVNLKDCRKRALCIIRRCLDEWIASEKQRESILLDSPFDVSSGAVSLHYPLHRFLALLATEAIRRYKFTFYEALGQSRQDVLHLAEHILRVQALLVQVKAGMWKRNGRPMVNRCILYKSSYCQEWFFDLDIAMMQLCCVSKGARSFLNQALEVFGLQSIMQVFKDSWLSDSSSSTHFGSRESVQDIWKFFAYEEYDLMIVQGFLRMLVYITAERVRIGYSDVERLRRKLIHRLCVGDQTHSSLLKTIPRRLTSSSSDEEAISIMGDEDFVSGGNGTDKHYKMFEECLNQVGIFQQPKEMDQGYYRLKDELWKEYDPFYPHYQSRERAIAEERHIQFRRKHHLAPHRLIFPQKSPNNLPLFDSFLSLLDLCREFCRPGGLACSVISRCLAFCREGKDLDGTLNATLYLIEIALETSSDSHWKTNLMSQVTFVQSVLICRNEQDRKEYTDNVSLAFLLECVQKCSSCMDQHEAAKQLLFQIRSGTPSSAISSSTQVGESSSQTREAKRREMRRKQQEALEKMRKQQEAFLKRQHSLFEQQQQEEEQATVSKLQEQGNTSVENRSTLEDHQNICSLCHEVASERKGSNLVVIGLVQRSNIPMLARRISRTTTSVLSSEEHYHRATPTFERQNCWPGNKCGTWKML